MRPEKIETCAQFEPLTSVVLVQCSPNRVNKPNGLLSITSASTIPLFNKYLILASKNWPKLFFFMTKINALFWYLMKLTIDDFIYSAEFWIVFLIPLDRIKELKKLNHSIVINFLELLDILIKSPSSPKVCLP